MHAQKFKSIQLKGKLMTFETPKIMAILNVTPDSFFDGGRYKSTEAFEQRIAQIIAEGADIIDIGGQSTRPGALPITTQEELDRVMPVIDYISKTYPDTILSIDTYRAEVAQKAIEAGAALVNDISAGNLDTDMIPTVALLNVPFIAMHSKGDSQTMQLLNQYEDLTKDLIQFFAHKIEQLQKANITDIVIDPGFGFAKNLEQNYALLQNIEYLQLLEKPVLVGISRKSMIYKALEINPSDALNGTTVLNTWAILKGANILRVHDVREAKQVIRLCEKLQKNN
jgi:dihydropteroate synthase